MFRSGIKRLRTQDPRSSAVVIHNGIIYTAGQVPKQICYDH